MQYYFQSIIIYVNNVHASNILKRTFKKKFVIRSLNHKNKSRNNDAFNADKHRLTNIKKTTTFINEIYYRDVNFLTNEKLCRVN